MIIKSRDFAFNSQLMASEGSNLLFEASREKLFSSNPYDYIDSDYYRSIVGLGPAALTHIRKMILESDQKGLREYLLAIAAEEIAKVDLKGDTFAWANAKEWCLQWDLHMRLLPAPIEMLFKPLLTVFSGLASGRCRYP